VEDNTMYKHSTFYNNDNDNDALHQQIDEYYFYDGNDIDELKLQSVKYISYIHSIKMNMNNDQKKMFIADEINKKMELYMVMQEFHKSYNRDPFYDISKVKPDDFESKHSVYDAALLIKKFINEESLTDVVAERLLIMMHELFPFAILPIKHIGEEKDNHNIKSNISSIVGDEVSLEFQHCSCGATVYLESNMTECKNCNEFRYYLCTSKDCPDKQLSSCAHNEYRTPKNTISYVPLMHIIQRLLNTKTFIRNIGYKQDPLFNTPGIYVDIMHAKESRKHLEEMQQKFIHWQSDDNKKKDFIPINLLFAINYDGSQIYKNKATPFVPLFISIINLPPSLRIKPDIGMFMLAIFTSVHNSNVENFLLHDLLGKELEILNKGIAINSDDSEHKYFVQGRLILHCYDTIAYQTQCKVKGANSYADCSYCGSIQG
jgi:hypothetical protein